MYLRDRTNVRKRVTCAVLSYVWFVRVVCSSQVSPRVSFTYSKYDLISTDQISQTFKFPNTLTSTLRTQVEMCKCKSPIRGVLDSTDNFAHPTFQLYSPSLDPSTGYMYYENTLTGERHWDLPIKGVLPLSPKTPTPDQLAADEAWVFVTTVLKLRKSWFLAAISVDNLIQVQFTTWVVQIFDSMLWYFEGVRSSAWGKK